MRAILLRALGPVREGSAPLELAECPDPTPRAGELLLRVSVCGICRTELDEIEGRTPPPRLPIILGHQAVGRVLALGEGTLEYRVGDRVGVAWIHSACGRCLHCNQGYENLCEEFQATGRDVHGGYAERMVVPAPFAHPIPAAFDDAEAAPLLCAGAIGFRSLRLTDLSDGQTLGLTGFGASGHLVLKLARHQFPNSRIFVFARTDSERAFALELGAAWAGDTLDSCPEKLQAIIDTTPVWTPLVEALANLDRGGRLVVNAIRKDDVDKEALLHLDYPKHLWLEKQIRSVANVTRFDVREFLRLAATIPLRPDVQEYALEEANKALLDLKAQKIRGAKVLRVS